VKCARRDIQADGDVEILEPDAHIATVAEHGKLHMEMRMKRGRGYVSADKNFDEDLGIGWIPIDIGPLAGEEGQLPRRGARLGQTTDYDKLTDGRLDQRLDQSARRRLAGVEAGSAIT